MNCLLSIFLLSLLLIVSWRKKLLSSYIKSFSIVWLPLIIIYYFCQSLFVNYAEYFDFYFVMFIMANVFSYAIFSLTFGVFPKIKIRKFFSERVLYYFAILTLFYCIIKFIIFFGLSGSFEALRANVLNEGWSFGVGIAFPFSAGAYYYARVHTHKRASILFLFSMIILAVISTAKMFFIIVLLYMSGFYLRDFKINAYKLIGYAVIGFAMFALIHILMNKISHKFPDSIVLSLIYTLTGYLFGGFGVFQLALDGLYKNGMGYLNFWDFLIDNWVQVGSISEGGWVYTGDWLGNVESGFTPWYLYAGIYGLLLLGGFMGMIYAFIFSFAKKYEEFLFLKVYAYYPLVFLIFYDTLMHSFTTWIGFTTVTFILLLTKDNYKLDSKREKVS